jgi:hypothetical protein
MVRPVVLAAGVFLGLAIFHTWPLSGSPARLSLNHNADAQLNEWIVSWMAHTLPTHPARLFDGNIFAPERQTLTYSEPLIVPALVGAPIRWLGGSPVLTFNLLLVAGLTLTALSAWFVVWRWTGSAGAAVVAGALAAFNVHLLTRLPHLQAAHAWGLPLVLYFADRLADRPTRRDAVWLAVTIAGVAATSLYWLFLAGVIIAIVVAGRLLDVGCGARGVVRATIAIGAASVLGLTLALPVLWPYVRFAATGVTRPIEMVAQFSATPAGYLVSTSTLYAAWTKPLHSSDVDVLFPGVTALGLAAVGFGSMVWGRTDTRRRRRAIVLAGIAGVGVLLSFGPALELYRWLYAWLPPLRGLRAAARFGYLLLLVLALASGFGMAWLERRLSTRRANALLVTAALAFGTAEVWQGPVHVVPFDGVPAIYTLLTKAHKPVLLVEVPFYPPDMVFENGEYVLNSTAHWQPLMNGYSGFTPDSYRRRAETLWLFPAGFAMQTLQQEGATHVMVHLDRFGADANDVARALDGRSDLRLIGGDRNRNRLYEVKPVGRQAARADAVSVLRDQ